MIFSLVAFFAYVVAAHGVAVFEYALYNDTNCTQEIYTSLVYKPIVETNESDGTQITVEWTNQTEARLGPGGEDGFARLPSKIRP